jgi:pilus assembly protein FimV
MDRPYLLTGLKFAPMLTPAGKPVISITSRDAIREPFLNFLIEVNWPKGRLVREYTVLLDPPVTLKRAPQPVTPPKTARTPVAPAPVPRSRPAMVTSSMSSEGGGREYGPVEPNDNLWNIAKGMQRGDESVEQVMMALQRYNPSAFINNNVNNLKVGKILRLPEDADVTSLSRKEAFDEFMVQTRAWEAERGRGEAGRPTVSGKPAESKFKEEDRLRLISSKPGEGEAAEREGMAESEDDISRLQDEVMLVRESNESAMQENQELRGRVKELEKQIQDIQRLLTLKSDQLAEIQAAQDIAEEKMEAVETPPAATQEPAPTAEPAVAEETVPTEPAAEPATAEAEAPVVPVPPDTQIEEVDIESRIDAAQQPGAPVAETAPPAVEPAQPAATPTTPTSQVEPKLDKPPVAAIPPKKVSYFDSLKENSTLVGIVGGVAVLLIGLLWMIMRRRKEAEAEFAESILVSPDSGLVTLGKDDSSSLTSPTDETSFMSDFSPSDIDALQDETGEVDPLSEADVYIAYGRYQQAEELIKQAIDKTPDREELKYKLAEIYFSAKKSDEFNALAQQLHDSGLEEKEPESWAKIAAMGKELDSSYALFAGAAGMAAGTAAAAEALEDLGLDLASEQIAEEEQKPESEDQQESADVDIDSMDLSGLENLDDMESESLESNLTLDSEFLNKMESGDSNVDEEEGLDIDLSDLDVEPDKSQAAEEPEPFDLSDIEGDSEIAPDLTASDAPDAIELEDSEALDDLDLESIEKELEGLSSELDGDESESLDEISLLHSHSENLDLDSTDEITTKLDLARAYIDMGDIEGAKSILDEVASEGTDAQQKEAQELLGTLGS